jgi:hypothetical protein
MKLCLFILVILIFVTEGAQASRHTITIDGTFVDAVSGRGLPKATIELQQRYWGFPLEHAATPLATTTTDRRGYFRFTGEWHGRFRLLCSSPDHKRFATYIIAGGREGLLIKAVDLTQIPKT